MTAAQGHTGTFSGLQAFGVLMLQAWGQLADQLFTPVRSQLPAAPHSIGPGRWAEHAACRGWSHDLMRCPVCDGVGEVPLGDVLAQRNKRQQAASLDLLVICPHCAMSGFDTAWFDTPALTDQIKAWEHKVLDRRLEVCDQCPVQAPCLAYYGRLPVSSRPTGVVAGRYWTNRDSGGDRISLPHPHGTHQRYRQGCGCAACREAHSRMNHPQPVSPLYANRGA